MKKHNVFSSVLCNVFVVLLATSVVVAQSSSQSSSQGAKSAASAPQTPSPSTAPFDTQMLTYGALDQISSEIATRVCGIVKDNARIVIYDSSSFATLQSYRGFLENVAILIKVYKSMTPQQDRLALETTIENEIKELDASNFISVGLPLVTQFGGSSIVENSANTTIPASSVAMNIANRLKAGNGCNPTIIYPQLYMPDAKHSSVGGNDAKNTSVGEDIEQLIRLKRTVEQSLVNKLKTKRDEAKQSNKDITKDANQDLNQDLEVLDYREINSLFNEFIKNYLTKDPNTGLTGIVPVVQGYTLLHLLQKEHTFVLYAEAIAAGGKQRIRKNLFTNLLLGDLISYSGGAVIAFALLDAKNPIIEITDILRYQTPNTNIKKPRNASATRLGDNLSKEK